MRRITQAAVWLAVLSGMGCEGAVVGTGGASRLTVQITDAPADRLASATIEVGEIVLLPRDGAPITLAEDAGAFDLLDLQNGVTGTLASLDVPAGSYHQLRLVVRSASVTLADGLTFADGSTTRDLRVPSGAQSGIKVNLAIELVPGETILVLDFDVGRNFVFTGPRDTPTGVLFRPLIRASVRDVAGSVAGQVTDAATGDPVTGLTVRAVLVESPVLAELQTAEATAATAADGRYTLWFLSPGTYTVAVEGVAGSERTVVVGEGERVTGVDLAITP